MGTRLKTANNTFIHTIEFSNASKILEKTKNLTNKPKNRPIRKLQTGPAIAMKAASRIGFF